MAIEIVTCTESTLKPGEIIMQKTSDPHVLKCLAVNMCRGVGCVISQPATVIDDGTNPRKVMPDNGIVHD